jgi:hypothetical protein
MKGAIFIQANEEKAKAECSGHGSVRQIAPIGEWARLQRETSR